MDATKRYALRFISGKYQGGEFALPEEGEVVIGRSSELDMVLVEDMVSRRHARIAIRDGQVMIEDFGSTNGSFVNGEKITKCILAEGDRILIGTSIIKVVRAGPDSVPHRGTPARSGAPVARRSTSEVRTMSGSLSEVALADLLQLFAASRKSGVLLLTQDEKEGRIYLRDGEVRFAVVGTDETVPPEKAFYRLLGWEDGMFELLTPEDRAFPHEMRGSVEGLLMEGMRQIDELNRLDSESLPAMDATVGLCTPLSAPLSQLSSEELDVLQLSLNFGRVETVLNKSQQADYEVWQAMQRLISKGFLRLD